MQLLTNVLLSPYLIFGVLALIFLVISYWSLVGLREYAGYILGVLVGLLVVFVVSSLGAQPDVEAQSVDIQTTTLNLFQATCPAILGIAIGIAFLVIPRLADATLPANYGQAVPRGINVAVITALWVTLLFLFFLVGIEVQRMIGIFALAFMIARLFAVVMAGGSNPNAVLIRQQNGTISAQSVDPNGTPIYDPLTGDPMGVVPPPTTAGNAFSRLDAIRARMQQRNLPPGQ
jgi:hypothetical protein